jgi:hypothetical protein
MFPSNSGSNKTKAPILSDISLAELCTRQKPLAFVKDQETKDDD